MAPASDKQKRRASPPRSPPKSPALRVLPVKSVGPLNIRDFPTVVPSAGEQANPQHGFVSRPGGAFKFQSRSQTALQARISQMTPKNPYQELRALTQPSLGSANTWSRTPNATMRGNLQFDASGQDLGLENSVSIDARKVAAEAELLELKVLHKVLASNLPGGENQDWSSDAHMDSDGMAANASTQQQNRELPGGRKPAAGADVRADRERRQNSGIGLHNKDGRAQSGVSSRQLAKRPNTSLGLGGRMDPEGGERKWEHAWVDDSSEFEDLLPSVIGRRSTARTAQLIRLEKMTRAKSVSRMQTRPYGALSNELVNTEASRTFGEGPDEAVTKDMLGISKFVEARALDLRLQNAIAEGNLILARPPVTEAKQRFYAYFIPELFAILECVVDAVGPFHKVLSVIRDQVRNLIYSAEKDFSHSSVGKGEALCFAQLVHDLKIEKDKLVASTATQSALMHRAEADKEDRIAEIQSLNKSVYELEKKLKDSESAREAMQATLDANKQQYSILKKKFHELQKGFLLGQLQDEMKEILMREMEEEKLGGGDVTEAIEEQSAMQRLIQQLKDSRQAMLNAQDDMNFWKGKYYGLEERMKNMQESFLDASNSLELTKNKLQNMVPSAVHLALQERYKTVLRDMSKLRVKLQQDDKALVLADKAIDRGHDDWKLYDKEPEEEGEKLAEWEDDEYEEPTEVGFDDPEVDQVPKNFVLSVAEQRDKLNQTYRKYRKTHNTSIVSWMQLKTMTLAEFARLEHDCFSKHSIWALALMRKD